MPALFTRFSFVTRRLRGHLPRVDHLPRIDLPPEDMPRSGRVGAPLKAFAPLRVMLVEDHVCAPPADLSLPVPTNVGRAATAPKYCCPECGSYFVARDVRNNVIRLQPPALRGPAPPPAA